MNRISRNIEREVREAARRAGLARYGEDRRVVVEPAGEGDAIASISCE